MKNSKFYPWVVVGLLWIVAFLNYMDRQMLSTMRDAMMIDVKELESAENFGMLMAMFLWIYALMSPIAGVIADRVNRKWLIVGSLFVWSSVTYAMGVVEDFDVLYLLRGLMGVSEALYIPAGLSLIADYHEGKSRSLAVGIHMTGLYFGQAIGGFGGTVAANYGWHTAFHWFGIIGVVYAVILALFLHEKRSGKAKLDVEKVKKQVANISVLKGMVMLLTNIAFWTILFMFAAPSLPGWAIRNWLPTLFTTSLEIDMAVAGPMATITIAVASFIGVFIGGPLSDKWVKRNVRGRIYTSAIGLSLTIPALIFLGLGNSAFTLVAAGICFGIGYGMFDANNMPIMCQFVPQKLRATAYGIMNMIGVFAGAVVTSLMGTLNESGISLGAIFAMLAGVVALAMLLQIFVLKPKTDNME